MNVQAASGGDVSHTALEGMSIREILATLIRYRYTIILISLVVGLGAALSALAKQPTFTAQFMIMPDGGDASDANIAALAGQLGVNMPARQATASPPFYIELLRSDAILRQIANDTFAIRDEESGLVRRPLHQILQFESNSEPRRRQRVVRWLRDRISSKLLRDAGLIRINVTTPWPELSYEVSNRLVSQLNEFNLQTRQTRAGNERRYLDNRVAEAERTLNAAEQELQRFLERNRQYQQSPQLAFERERLERRMEIEQERVMALQTALYEARLAEVRDIPTLTLVEAPEVPPVRDARRLAYRSLLGLIFGAVIGAFGALAHYTLFRRPGVSAAEEQDLATAWNEAVLDVKSRLRRSRRPVASGR